MKNHCRFVDYSKQSHYFPRRFQSDQILLLPLLDLRRLAVLLSTGLLRSIEAIRILNFALVLFQYWTRLKSLYIIHLRTYY